VIAMIGKEITDSKEITLSEVKNILTKRKKEGELSYEQKLAYDYSAEFGNLPVTKARALVEGLMTIEGIDDNIAVQIADTLPKDKIDLLIIFEKRRKSISDGDIKKVLDLVAKAQE